MTDSRKLLHAVENGGFDEIFRQLYPAAECDLQRKRYRDLLHDFETEFGPGPVALFSIPGRTELGGNHTDHNFGRVLAGSIHLDTICAAAPDEKNRVLLRSQGYSPVEISLNSLQKDLAEKGMTEALVRGIAFKMDSQKHRYGGFRAVSSSRVLKGSGLSSSAVVELLVGAIFNDFFNDSEITVMELASAGRYAENEYFGKPCGLLDQVSCGWGGVVTIDFRNSDRPAVEAVDCAFSESGYSLFVVDTGGHHAGLTHEYAAIPAEMKAVAAFFGAKTLSETSLDSILANARSICKKHGDRAFMRSIHFHRENERVTKMVEALREKNYFEYLDLVRKSGDSSWRLLQNCLVPSDRMRQEAATGIALTELFLGGKGAVRIHGGGFAGTIQAYIPRDMSDGYRTYIESFFGSRSATMLSIRAKGIVRIDPNLD